MRVFRSPITSPSALIRPHSPWIAAGAALLVAGVAVLVRLNLSEALDEQASFLIFVPAVVVGAAFGGAGPGVFATLLGLSSGLLLARGGQAPWLETGLFVIVCAAVTLGGEWFQRVHRELSGRETHLRLILNTVPDAMILIDEGGTMRAFSPAAERLFGWAAEEAVGRNVSMLMPSPHREAHDSYLERYERTKERRIIGLGRVVVGERRDGSTFPMELAVGEMRTAEGRFFTGFVRDLTERQQAEARLQELQADLVRVSRLTALGEMASALAHELNQPLTAISNYLKGSRRLLAGDTVSLARVGDAVDRAAEQALRAGVIIRRLRDFVARGDTERRIEDLPKLVEEACALALVGVREHGVRVRIDIDPAAGWVVADKVQVQQVLLNLIRNAVDVMEEASVRHLGVTVVPVDEERVRITVSDTGAGISPGVADQLFQPFVTTKRTGMGVGLSISRTIIEAHGGRIWFDSNEAGGTNFHFTLQRSRPEEDSADDE
ncbi:MULTISPECIES: sensor histidine kinase [unclassified Brevundimonas]|uniref:sensor histidine kinase n=1 Tax=unclassified Brevundimonas TaxID=2622653 RepID=UPI0025BD567D|nr:MULTISPECIES: PAS domain-containing sensor histidine kinase [unclassified Brevundimonas]